VATFERNLVTLRSRLRIGLKVHLWEEGQGSHINSFECLLTLDRLYEALVFTAVTTKKGFSMFISQKIEVVPVKIKDIDECCVGGASMMDLSLMSVLGLSGQAGTSEENAVDTLTIKIGAKVVDGESLRVVSLKLANRADRDFLHSAISTMISDLHVSRGKNAPQPTVSAGRSPPLPPTGQSLNKLARDVSPL
jgi:hypothetical protein